MDAKQKKTLETERFKVHEKYRFNKGFTFDIQSGAPIQNKDHPFLENAVSKNCRVHKLSKGNGKFRIIYAPNYAYKEFLRKINKDLETQLNIADIDDVFTAFRHGQNVVSNAKKHIGFKYTMKVDMFNFFDTVTPEMVEEYEVPSYCFINGVPRQGLPTSPMVASLALVDVMSVFMQGLDAQFTGKTAVTVYADDITISFNNRKHYEGIRDLLYEHIKAAGLKVNYRKTKLLFGHKPGMRRIICGVSVGSTDVRRSRETKMRVNKAIYKNKDDSVIAGLMQWEACKLPNLAKQKYRADHHETFFETRTNKRGREYRVKK